MNLKIFKMKTKKVISVVFSLFFCLLCQAQHNDVLLTNSQSVDDNLYEDIKGSPFYFDNWREGKIFPKDEHEPIEVVLLNFNGYTKNFEVKRGKRFIALDEHWYKRVEIDLANQDNIIFETNLFPKKDNQFVQLVYKGSDFYVIQDFHVSLVKKERARYAGNIEVQTFAQRPTYYFVENGSATLFKLKKKNILSLFTLHISAVEQYVKVHRLKLTNTTDLVKVMTYYEELTRPTDFENIGEKQ